MRPGIAGPGRALVGREVDYIVVPGEAAAYRWQVTGGEILSGQDMPGITVRWQQAGPQHVEVAVETEAGQVVKDKLLVTVDNS